MSADSIIGALDQTAQAFSGLPWGVHALVGAGGAAGLILWLAGRRVLKPTIVLLFALAGGAGALMLVPKVSFAESAPEATWAVVGIVAGALLGLALFRFAMAVALGTVLGLAAPLGAAVALEVAPAPPADDRVAAAWHAAAGTGPMGEDHARGIAAVAGEELDAQWGLLPGREQAVLAMSAVGGAMLGVLLGLLMPIWASGAVSALLGPAVWLPCGVWLAGELSMPGGESLARSPVEWLIIWGCLALFGLVFQWTGLLRRAAPRRADPA